MKKYILPIILVCSFLLRIYKGQELFFWNIDEDIIGLTVKRMLIDLHPQLIGFPIPGGIYLGPLFYYIISLFYLIAWFNPSNFYILSALLGTFTVFLVYKVGETIFEKKSIGILASIIYGFSYFSSVYSRLLTGLALTPILAILTYLILYKNIKLKEPKWQLLLGLVLLVSSQNEGSSLSLIVLSIVCWVIFKFKVPIKNFFKIALLFIIFHIPLLIFDLRHNFFIGKSFVAFLRGGERVNSTFSFQSLINVLEIFPLTISRILYPSGELSTSAQILPCTDLISQRISGIPILVFLAASIILAIFLLNFCLKKKKTYGEKIIALHFIVILAGICIFNIFLTGYLYEWILIVFLPAFCMIVAFSVIYLYEKNILLRGLTIILLICFMFFNVKAVLNSHDNFGLAAKQRAVDAALEKVDGRDFSLESIGSCYQTGYMYLFWQKGHFPTSSWMDDMFSPTYYPRVTTAPDVKVIISSPSENEGNQFFEKYNRERQSASKSVRIGRIEVLVVEDNK